MNETCAIIVAAGRGTRLPGDLPKQYLRLDGQALLRHSLARLTKNPSIDKARAVIHPDDLELYGEAAEGLDLLPPVFGGATRQESVLRGLESLSDLSPSKVLIHDGARPFASEALIARVAGALDAHEGAIAALPVTDTLKREDNHRVAGTVDRQGLWRAQTPQGFRFASILEAHRAADGLNLTDDAAVAEAAGMEVALVEGDEDNFKVTTPQDVLRAQRLLSPNLETRVGTGFDVHRFEAGATLYLCGVRIPHDRGLSGHSDADVGLHALTDAILGALGAGDIGEHFPPSDPRWRGAESAIFMRHAAGLVAERRGRIVNLDLTLICERPKLSPHRLAMRQSIAEILALPLERVSVKATTTERLGFTGRNEGIAAQATATLALPEGG